MYRTLLKLALHLVILPQQFVDGSLHAASNAVAVPLHQLDDALRRQEERVSLGPPLQSCCVPVHSETIMYRTLDTVKQLLLFSYDR